MAIERHAGILQSFRTLFGPGTLGGRSDGELLDRASRRGDPAAEQAFAALVERHGPMVLRVCRSRLIDPNDADDAFQRVFCLLARRSRTLWVRDSLAPWLFQVALRVSAGVRAEVSRRRDVERRYAEHAPRIAPAREPDDLAPLLLDEVGRLPERYRSAIVLCDLQGLTHEEAARRLGWPIGTVKSRQARARARLRRRLIGRGLAPTALVAIASRSAPAAIPRALAERAVPLALQSAASSMGFATGAVSLVTGALTMLTSHPIATLAGGLLLTGAAVVGAGALARQDDQAPRQTFPVAAPRVKAVQLPRVDEYEEPEFLNVGYARTPDPEAAKDWQAPPVPESIPVTVSGTAINTANRPVSGATVMLMSWLDAQVLARATTDENGAYRFDDVEVPVDELHGTSRRPEASPYTVFVIVATCPGYGIAWSSQQQMYAIDPPHPLDIQRRLPLGEPVTVDLTFRPADVLRGTVVDERDRPREGIEVSILNADLLDADGLETSRTLDGVWKGLPDGLGRATTGPDGRFLLDGLPSETCFWVRVQDPEFETTGLTFYAATTGDPVSRHPEPQRHSGRGPHDAYGGDMLVTWPTLLPVPVRVVGDDSGEPIANARVRLQTEFLAIGLHSGGSTDADGLVTLALPPGDSRGFSADPPIETHYIRTYGEPLTIAPEPIDAPLELRMQAGFELVIDAIEAETGDPLPDALFWLVPTDDPYETEQIQPSTSSVVRPWTDAEGRLRAVLFPRPGQEYRVRFAGMRLPNHTAYHFPDPSARPRFEVDPPLSEPFELIAGETIRLRFTLRPVGPRAEPSEPSPADPAADPPPPAVPDDGPDRDEAAVPETIPVTVSGRARDTAGKPVAGATILLLGGAAVVPSQILAQTETDEEGAYRFEEVEAPVSEPSASPFRQSWDGPFASLQVVGTAPGFGLAWKEPVAVDAIDVPDAPELPGRVRFGEEMTMDMVFRPAESLGGTIIDERGRSTEGMELKVVGLTLLDPYPGEPKQIGPLRSPPFGEDFGRASTGPGGRFRIAGLPSGALCRITLRQPGFDGAGASFSAVTIPPAQGGAGSTGHVEELHGRAMSGDFILTVPRLVPVRVRIVEESSGVPVPGVIVSAIVRSTRQPWQPISSMGASDRDGFLTLGLPARREFVLIAKPPADSIFPQPILGDPMPEARRIVVPADPNDDVLEIRLRRGCELIVETTDAETGEPLAEALYWLVPEDDPDEPRPIGHSRLIPDVDRLEQSGGRLRVVLRSEPGRTFRARFAGFLGQRPPAFSPEARELPPRFEADPPESEPFELIAGETVRLRFAVRPADE
ncbi:sigma-70 family RNA polymerase sigma factor [Tautonia sp. JC769]|uniref:sigma-70 family RNA polymerase sigma factor n=1 Tax=Tautonia sp. JC769 TaxID=3232135 RepID=UPI00345832E5